MVRVRSPGKYVARPLWYDRNPANQTRFYFSAAETPHGETSRWTYTVPAGKKAMLELICAFNKRATAATTLGRVTIRVYYTPSGGSAIVVARTHLVDNTVDAIDRVVLSMSFFMLVGDLLETTSYDGSTGGSVEHGIMAKITEFDA